MALSEVQKGRCKAVMDEISKRAISRMFNNPVDPELYPNYKEIVSKPMDLGTVNKKLDDNQYSTVAEWKADVELIWSNSLVYNKSNPLLTTITKEMQDVYNKQIEFLTDDIKHDWNQKLVHLRDQLWNAADPYRGNASSKKGAATSRPKSTSPKPNKVAKSPKSKKKPVNKKPLSKNAIVRLAKQISDIKDNNVLVSILDIIEEEEDLVANGESFEFDLGSFKQSTLILLRNKLAQLMPQTQ